MDTNTNRDAEDVMLVEMLDVWGSGMRRMRDEMCGVLWCGCGLCLYVWCDV
jgi:hypothetical protein